MVAQDLRVYQKQALERAREGNIVVVGRTGIGKTRIALCLLQEVADDGGK